MAAFEVIALDTATPQLRAPGASDTYTFPRAVEMPLGTANGVLYLNGSNVVSSGTRLQFDGNSLNLASPTGTPISGGFSIRLRDVGGDANDTGFGVDASANLWQNVAASGPSHIWYIGGTEQMRLGGAGNLGIGTNPASGMKLDVAGDANLRAGFYTNGSTKRIHNYMSGDSLFWVRESLAGSYEALPLILDASGNLGLGVTPSAWNLGKALEINFVGNSVWGATTTQMNILQNAYWNSGYKYANSVSSPASYYSQISGVHSWHNAPSGTAGNAISFTQAMTLDANGNLLVGTTSSLGRATFAQDQNALTTVAISNGNVGANAGTKLQIDSQGGPSSIEARRNGGLLVFTVGAADRITLDQAGNVAVGPAAIATNATNGFFYVPGCAGTPTGTPTAYTGRVPIVVDTTNNKLYFYSGGAWRDAGP